MSPVHGAQERVCCGRSDLFQGRFPGREKGSRGSFVPAGPGHRGRRQDGLHPRSRDHGQVPG